MPDTPDTTSRITAARDHLTEKLAELRRRQVTVVTALAPLRYLANPWVGLGIATLVGYRLGRPPRACIAASATVEPRPLATPVEIKPAETWIRAIVRASAITVVQTLARRAVMRLVDEH